MIVTKRFFYTVFSLIGPVLCATPLKIDFEIHRGDSHDSLAKGNSPFVSKRDTGNGVELTLQNEIASYVATIKLGSNQQEVTVLIDISDSDTWVMSKDVKCIVSRTSSIKRRDGIIIERSLSDSPNNTVTSRSSSPTRSIGVQTLDQTLTGDEPGDYATSNTCINHGSFETSGSSSYLRFNDEQGNGDSFYTDGYTNGIWGNDSISIGGAKVNHFVFGIANVTSLNFGRLGLGSPQNAYYPPDSHSFDEYLPTLPVALKDQGIIDRAAYSLYINSSDASSGSILFGAVDHAKYFGDLMTFPMLPPEDEVLYDIAVPLTRIRMQFDTGSEIFLTENDYFVSFEPASSMSVFPQQLYDRLLDILNTTKVSSRLDEVPCPLSDSSVTFDFDFNGAVISVPLTSLIVSDNSGRYSDEIGKCYLAVEAYDGVEPNIVLGDNIMRHGYFVFDLEAKSVSIAKARFTDEEDIEVISNSVPQAVRGSSTSINTSSLPTETSTRVIVYSTGSFSGPDYVSTAIVPYTYTPTSSFSSSSIRSRKSRNGGPNCVNRSVTHSITAAIFVLLSYISLV